MALDLSVHMQLRVHRSGVDVADASLPDGTAFALRHPSIVEGRALARKAAERAGLVVAEESILPAGMNLHMPAVEEAALLECRTQSRA